MTPPLERIVWADHVEPEGNVWWTPEEYAAITGPCLITTVGWVVIEHDGWLAIASTLSMSDGWGSRPTVIVKSCITSRQTLGVARVLDAQSHAP